jgi:glycosyltransferase involved in cell wall biosynthesis
MKPQTLVVGPVPPPRHGAATINECVARECERGGLHVRILSTTRQASAQIRSGRADRLRVIGKVSGALATALRGEASSSYVSVSGGFAILYECLFALLVRLHSKRLVLHHHSYRYLNCFFLPAWCLARLAGPKATHVCLSEDMERRLKDRYRVSKTLRLSNAAFLPAVGEPPSVGMVEGEQMVIGLLSNLCPEKGLDDFLTVCRRAEECGYPWKFRLAGPFLTKSLETAYGPRLRGVRNLDYVGAVYETEKAAFIKSLDVFLFPTRYPDEAEPIVLLEAMREGVPCIAFGRGSIPEILSEGGLVVAPGDDFAGICSDKLEEWAASPAARQDAGLRARNRFTELREESAKSFEQLFGLLSMSGKKIERVAEVLA